MNHARRPSEEQNLIADAHKRNGGKPEGSQVEEDQRGGKGEGKDGAGEALYCVRRLGFCHQRGVVCIVA